MICCVLFGVRFISLLLFERKRIFPLLSASPHAASSPSFCSSKFKGPILSLRSRNSIRVFCL